MKPILQCCQFRVFRSKITFSKIFRNYKVLFYNGQVDIIVAYPLTENFLSTLEYKFTDEYKNSSRVIWKVGNEIAGYATTYANMTQLVVRNAGHLVPHDQPKWAYDMIHRFVFGKSFGSDTEKDLNLPCRELELKNLPRPRSELPIEITKMNPDNNRGLWYADCANSLRREKKYEEMSPTEQRILDLALMEELYKYDGKVNEIKQ